MQAHGGPLMRSRDPIDQINAKNINRGPISEPLIHIPYMPPRAAPARGGRGGTGPPRGGRGAGPQRGGGDGGPFAFGLPSAGSHITTVGVKRPNFGTGGRELPIFVNSFVTTIPEGVIHHYDGKPKINVGSLCTTNLLTIFLGSRFVYPKRIYFAEILTCLSSHIPCRETVANTS